MDNDSEAIYNEDNDDNLVIEDVGNEEPNDDYEPPGKKSKQSEPSSETPSSPERIQKSDDKIKLTPQERGKKLAELSKQRFSQGTKKKPRSLSQKAGVIFPVKRIIDDLKQAYPEKIISKQTGIYFAAVLEYLCSEVLDLAGTVAIELKKKRITPHYIQLAINGDEELHKLLHDVIISQGGVTPHIQPELLVTKSSKKRKRSTEETTETESTVEEEPARPKPKSSELTELGVQTNIREIDATLPHVQVVDDASQTESQVLEDLSPSASQTERPKTVNEPNTRRRETSENVITSEIPSAQAEPTSDETQEISEIYENISKIGVNRESTPINFESEETSDENEMEQTSTKLTRLDKENVPELERESQNGNSSKYVKKDLLNLEYHLNEQKSLENFLNTTMSNKSFQATPMSSISLQNILRPLDNSILVTDRKIIPNVTFEHSQSHKKTQS